MTDCDHGISFDVEAAAALLGSFKPKSAVEFVLGNPMHSVVRQRWPRLAGLCPKGCGYNGIAYVSEEHYTMGDW